MKDRIELVRPDLWKFIEMRCQALQYGKLFVEVDVHDGRPKQVAVERIRETFRGDTSEKAKELIE